MGPARGLSVRQAEAASRRAARSDSVGPVLPVACSAPVAMPRRKHTRAMLSGGRGGLVVRVSAVPGAGLGLFAGPAGVPPGGFIALHMGEWEWVGGADGVYEGTSAYAVDLGDWRLVTPLRVGEGATDRYHAARINEPAPGTRANSFARIWTGRGQVLSGGGRAICLAMHAGAQGLAPGEEVTWNYGDQYARAYEVGGGCAPLGPSLCELPSSCFMHEGCVPRSAYRRT